MIRTLIVSLALLTGPAWAQQHSDAAPAPARESSPNKTTEPQPATPSDDSASGNAEGSVNSTEGSLTNAEGSPLDYRSSEQISEDLSVSFPVDI